MRIEKESTHSSARAQSRARNRPRERGSGGAVRAARARSGGASAAVRRAIAARTPLRRAPLRPSAAPLAASSLSRASTPPPPPCAAVCSSSRRQPPMPIEMGTERAFRCSFSHAENLSQATDHRSAAVGGVRTDLARAARDVAGELSAVAASGGAGGLRRGARGRARLSSQRERRQKSRWPAWVETSTAIQKFLQAAHARQARGAGSVAEARRAHSSAEGVSAGRRPPSAFGLLCDVSKGGPPAHRCTLPFGLRLSQLKLTEKE